MYASAIQILSSNSGNNKIRVLQNITPKTGEKKCTRGFYSLNSKMFKNNVLNKTLHKTVYTRPIG